MRLSSVYTLTFIPSIPGELRMPMNIERPDYTFDIHPRDDDQARADGLIAGPVNPDTIQIHREPEPLDGSDPGFRLEIPELSDLVRYLENELALIAFLTDTPIRYSHQPLSEELIAESEHDREMLTELPQDDLIQPLEIGWDARTFRLSDLRQHAAPNLLDKEFGLALYHQASLIQHPIGSFREYWKLLESAFASTDSDLIELLQEYEPAQDLGFDDDELRGLLVLRGRASHAQGSSGVEENRYVRREATEKLPRLKSLAEQVLLTKRSWGVPTLATERLAPIDAYISSEGDLVLVRG